MLNVRHCTIDELTNSSSLPALLADYTESSLPEIGTPNPQFQTYQRLEQVGLLFPFGAWEDERLIGFLLILITDLPHYGKLVAVSESYFVAKESRKTGAGLRLLNMAKEYAASQGAAAFLVSAPKGSSLEKVMEGLGWRNTNVVYGTSLNE